MRRMLSWRYAISFLFALGMLPYVAGGAPTDLALVAVSMATVVAAVWGWVHTPAGRLMLGLILVAQSMGVILMADRLVHGGAAGIVGAAAGVVGVSSYLLATLAMLRVRRPSDYLDGVSDGFAALAGTVAVQWQWSALDEGATLESVASITTPLMGLFCLITTAMVYWRVAGDPRMNKALPLAVTTSGALMSVAVVSTATFSSAHAPPWGLAAWLLAGYLMTGFVASPDFGLLVMPEPPQRRVFDMRLLGPALALMATPLMMLTFVVRGAQPNVAAVAGAAALAGVALWRGKKLLSEQAKASRELAGEQRFRALVEHSTGTVLILDPDLSVRYVGGGVLALCVSGGTEPIRADLETVFGEEAASAVRHAVAMGSTAGGTREVGRDLRLAQPDGENRYVTVSITDHRVTPTIEGWVLNVHDVTARKKAEAALSRLALEDPLTGLPNRVALRTRLEEALAHREGATALLFCDLNGFKAVNDTLGHEKGDELLRRVAGRWSAALRADDVLGRWGGDEFLVICEVLGHPVSGEDERPEDIGRRLISALEEPLLLDGVPAHVGVSVGVVVHLAGEGPDQLLARADAAMYAAKRSHMHLVSDAQGAA